MSTTWTLSATMHVVGLVLSSYKLVHADHLTLDAVLAEHDISKLLNKDKQCRNFYGVEGATREVLTACRRPITDRSVSRLTRATLDRYATVEGYEWVQSCYQELLITGLHLYQHTNFRTTDTALHLFGEPYIYVDVVKSASESIRGVLSQQGVHRWLPKRRHRNVSADITPAQRHHFIWSIVRDPVTRFLSSFQQAVFQNVCAPIKLSYATLAHANSTLEQQQQCLDWCVRELLTGHVVNLHFQTQAFRLLTVDSENRLLDYSFIGKLDNVKQYWANLFQHLFRGTNISDFGAYTLPHFHHQGITVDVEILPWHILALCTFYAQDFVCFDYELPTLCKGAASATST